MRRSFLLYIVVFAGIVLAGASIYFGAILPFAKAKHYIAAERNLRQVRSVPEFIANFERAARTPSPVGDEEIAKFLGGKILDVVTSLDLPEKDSRTLVEYADEMLFKDEVRHLMLSGHLYKTMWEKFGSEAYYSLAETRFKAAHEIGPKLPTPLYALYTLYAAAGDEAGAALFQGKIEALWPEVKEVSGYFGG